MSEWPGSDRPLVLLAAPGADAGGLLSEAFRREGCAVEEVRDGDETISAVATRTVSLVILDMAIPKLGGIEVLSALRRTSEVPVILVSGQVEQRDRILGLNLGADDYIDRPLSPLEVVARARAVLRRGAAPLPSVRLEFHDLVINLTERTVLVEGQVIKITRREFDLLAFLASSPRQVFSREQLLGQVWRSSGDWQSPKTVTEHIRRLRLRLDCNPERPCRLVSVRGVGYQFRP